MPTGGLWARRAPVERAQSQFIGGAVVQELSMVAVGPSRGRAQAAVSLAPLHESPSGEPVNLTYPVASYPIAHESIQLASRRAHIERQWRQNNNGFCSMSRSSLEASKWVERAHILVVCYSNEIASECAQFRSQKRSI